MKKTRKKITVDISEELHQELVENVMWGLRGPLVIAVLDMVIAASKEGGQTMLGSILDGRYKLARDD